MANKKRGRIFREKRRESAVSRNQETALLSPQERIDRLDEKFGVGVGAGRERARLSKLVDNGD